MSDRNRDHGAEAQSTEDEGELRRQLEEAQQTLEAIRQGDVDALVVTGPKGAQVYSLAGVEHVYRVIVETMNEAALTVDPGGTILFCNRRFCELVKTPMQGAIGHKVTAFAAGPQQMPLKTLLADARNGPVQRRLTLRAADGTAVLVQLAASLLETADRTSICLVISDLTELEASAHSVRVLREHQQALEESEERFRAFMDNSTAIAWLKDEEGRYVYLSKPYQRRFGVEDVEDWKGKTDFELWPRETAELFRRNDLQVFRTGQALTCIEETSNPDGSRSSWWNSRFLVQDGQGRRHVGGIGVDITDRQRAQDALRNANEELLARAEQLQTANAMLQAKQQEVEATNEYLRMQEAELVDYAEALRASQERLALAARGTRIGMYDWDIGAGETLWTEQMARLLGLRTTTTVSQCYHYHDWCERIHPEDLPRVEAELRRGMAEHVPYEAEYRVVWPDGSVHWVADRGIFQYESNGSCARMLGILMDITERKQAEEALRENQALVRAVMDGSPDLIYVKDVDGRILMANPAACEALGRSAKEVIGKSAREFHSDNPEMARAIMENDRRVMESGEMETIEEVGGKGRAYLSTKAPYRGAAGKVIGLIGISHDITERKQAEEVLKIKNSAIASSLSAIAISDLEGRLTYVNPAFLKLWRYEEEREVLGKPVLDFWKEPGQAVEVVQAIRNGEGWVGELVAVRKDGVCRSLHLSASTVLNDVGFPICMMASFVDISERKQAEEALRELNATLESKVAERTAQLEQRAKQLQKLTLELSQAEERERRRIALILHEDLQQQMAGAKFHLNLLRKWAVDTPRRAAVDNIDEMLKEAIEKSRGLSHDLSPAVLHMNDLAEVLHWLAKRVRAQHHLHVRVEVSGATTLQSEALALFLFRAAQEMLFNVVKHARVHEAAIRVRRIGRYLCLSVSDRGCGFDPQDLKESSGFGLLSIRERVGLLGGRTKIKSAEGQGSTLRIVVPDSREAED